MCGVVEHAATHALLPRKAIVRFAAHDAEAQLMREACVLEAVKHPGVPRVFECGLLEDRRPWIVMLFDRMTSSVLVQPSTAEVRAEAMRLLENVDVEEVEIELIDLGPLAAGGYS